MEPLDFSSANNPKPTILVVEDSALAAGVLCDGIQKNLGWKTAIASSFQETRKLIAQPDQNFFAALIDLTLPDSDQREHVDFITEAGIPGIILTADYDKHLRDHLLSKTKVVDYFIKSSGVVEVCTKLLDRLWKNTTTSVLIVDDMLTQRKIISRLLRKRLFQIELACNAEEALEILEHDTERRIKLALVDYHMPKMTGDALIAKIRETYPKEEMGLIGMTSQEGGLLSVHFLKNGASDFIRTPFVAEELFCRVDQTLEYNETLTAVRQASYRDPLTQLYNRRYFSEVVGDVYNNAIQTKISMAIAILDIDHFKGINDTYGHAAGDAALCHLTHTLKRLVRSCDVLARWGGEEFCLMLANLTPDAAKRTVERIRKAVEASSLDFEGQKIQFTVSIGGTMKFGDSLDTMISEADELLYQAKTSGRNQTIMSTKPEE